MRWLRGVAVVVAVMACARLAAAAPPACALLDQAQARGVLGRALLGEKEVEQGMVDACVFYNADPDRQNVTVQVMDMTGTGTSAKDLFDVMVGSDGDDSPVAVDGLGEKAAFTTVSDGGEKVAVWVLVGQIIFNVSATNPGQADLRAALVGAARGVLRRM